jgi:biotin-dependent carboxylase-like uncharacterized protein
MIEILSIGSGLALQDRGRPGWRRFGVPPGGAMDLRSMTMANTLLGNPTAATVLEVAQPGARLRMLQDGWLALAGADFSSRFATGTARPLRAGEVLEFDQTAAGLYAYIAVPGGFCAERWLDSASTDVRNGMGRPLQKGDCLESLRREPNISTAGVARRITSEPLEHIESGPAPFALYPGAQFEAFSEETRKQFINGQWTVSPQSDRSGYRLAGPALAVPGEIASEPVLPGSFQVPGGGQPIVTMHDGPTVGGYAKIAVLRADDLDRFAQCAPGTRLSFAWIR